VFAQKAAVKKVRERQSLPSSNLISLLVGFGEHESIELLEVPFPPPETQLPAENSISRCLPMPEAFTARCVLSMSRTRPRQMSEAIKLKLRDEILPDAFDNKKLIFPPSSRPMKFTFSSSLQMAVEKFNFTGTKLRGERSDITEKQK
jgi:hypothetical protein